jgi:hypothetical protein
MTSRPGKVGAEKGQTKFELVPYLAMRFKNLTDS